MTVREWIGVLRMFDGSFEVLVRMGSEEHDVLYMAVMPKLTIDAGCTDTEMLVIDMMDGDGGVDGVLALGDTDYSGHKCDLVGESALRQLMVKYLGGAKENLTPDETEILLFALYRESLDHAGLAKIGTDEMDERLRTQNERTREL